MIDDMLGGEQQAASSKPMLQDYKQCVKQSSRGSCQPIVEGLMEGGTVQRPPEALRRSRFFFGYLVAISFPVEFMFGADYAHISRLQKS